jgi:hypothetical protein
LEITDNRQAVNAAPIIIDVLPSFPWNASGTKLVITSPICAKIVSQIMTATVGPPFFGVTNSWAGRKKDHSAPKWADASKRKEGTRERSEEMMNVDKRVLTFGGDLEDSKPACKSPRPVLYSNKKPRRRARKSSGQAKMGRILRHV